MHIPIKSENSNICTPCGGQCCKHYPGRFSAEQIFTSPDIGYTEVRELLMSGKYILLWQDRSHPSEMEFVRRMSRTLCIAPRGILGAHVHKTWDEVDNYGVCVFLTETGCSLSFEKRPVECQELIPVENGGCHHPKDWNVDDAVISSWDRFQGILIALRDEYWDKHVKKV